MGSQPLGAKRTRFYERQTGLSLDRVLSHGGTHWLSFRTPDHRHGGIHSSTYQVIWIDNEQCDHWTSCRERFPEDFEKEPPYRYIERRGSPTDENGV